MQDDETVRKGKAMLTEILRNERNMSVLSPIPQDFFPTLQRYLEVLAVRAKRADGEEVEPEISRTLSKAIRSEHRRVREIFSLRLQKILRYARLGVSMDYLDDATPQERETYTRMRGIVESYLRDAHARAGLVRSGPGPLPGTREGVDDGAKIRTGQEEPSHAGTLPHPRAREPDTLLLIRVLEDVPTFAGIDRNYTLRKGDVVGLPEPLARTLITRGCVEPVRDPDRD